MTLGSDTELHIVICTMRFIKYLSKYCGTGLLSQCSDSLWAGRRGDRVPVGGEIFRAHPDWPWDPPSLLYSGYRIFPGG